MSSCIFLTLIYRSHFFRFWLFSSNFFEFLKIFFKHQRISFTTKEWSIIFASPCKQRWKIIIYKRGRVYQITLNHSIRFYRKGESPFITIWTLVKCIVITCSLQQEAEFQRLQWAKAFKRKHTYFWAIANSMNIKMLIKLYPNEPSQPTIVISISYNRADPYKVYEWNALILDRTPWTTTLPFREALKNIVIQKFISSKNIVNMLYKNTSAYIVNQISLAPWSKLSASPQAKMILSLMEQRTIILRIEIQLLKPPKAEVTRFRLIKLWHTWHIFNNSFNY